eukprot:TRINITY_DN32097_c0_g1_i1.p1 TRINITY_DN32097_c0_g1~~TRINITY_DN32097_c0_g1_i1.p1  ORF type:complete len:1159 (-),score=228.77 TRINITY_DN32097_c0_g1_i1:11-3487(-)
MVTNAKPKAQAKKPAPPAQQGPAKPAAKQAQPTEARRETITNAQPFPLAQTAQLASAPSKAVLTVTGETYEGEFDAKGRRHGRGTLTWANGNRYDGEWEEGRMTGRAVFTYGGQNGDLYEGCFLDDKKHGEGKYTFANGNTYTGLFQNDKRHGNGEYRWVCGDRYIGEWCEGKMHGKGITTYANGNKYEGLFKEDKREGWGKLECVDGLRFEGDWKNNMRNGYGVLVFPNGDKYEGGWLDDQKDGEGVDTFVNGNCFRGQYSRNAKTGRGVMTFSNGDEYSGEWLNDTMHGRGTYTFSNGFVYEGEWQNDLRHGRGVYTYNNAVYDGEWKDDKRTGKGVLTIDGSAEVYRGEWENGKMDGKFEVQLNQANGTKLLYSGDWKQGVAHGPGTFTLENGARFTGTWDFAKVQKAKQKEMLNPIAIVNSERAQALAANGAPPRRTQDEQHLIQKNALLIEDLRRENSTLRQQVANLSEDKDHKRRDQDQEEAVRQLLAKSHTSLQEYEQKSKDLHEQIEQLKGALNKMQCELEAEKLHFQESHLRAEQLHVQCQQKDVRIAELQELLDGAASQPQAPPSPIVLKDTVSQERLSKMEEELQERDRQIAELRQRLEEMADEHPRVRAERDNARADLLRAREDCAQEVKAQAARIVELERRLVQANGASDSLQDLRDRLAASEKSREQTEEQLSAADACLKEVELGLAAARKRQTELETQVAQLTSSAASDERISELERQLNEAEEERRQQLSDMKPTMQIIDDLKEQRKDLQTELRLAQQDVLRLKEEVATEKKRRKRAEKLQNEDASVEGYKNQVTHLRSELEHKEAQIAAMENQMERLKPVRGNGKREAEVPAFSENTQQALLEVRIKQLLDRLEEKDRLLQQQAAELRKVTLLEAQLVAANDKIAVLSHGAEANERRDLARLAHAQSQMDTRYLLSGKRGEEDLRAAMNRQLSNADMSRRTLLGRSGSGSGADISELMNGSFVANDAEEPRCVPPAALSVTNVGATGFTVCWERPSGGLCAVYLRSAPLQGSTERTFFRKVCEPTVRGKCDVSALMPDSRYHVAVVCEDEEETHYPAFDACLSQQCTGIRTLPQLPQPPAFPVAGEEAFPKPPLNSGSSLRKPGSRHRLSRLELGREDPNATFGSPVGQRNQPDRSVSLDL